MYRMGYSPVLTTPYKKIFSSTICKDFHVTLPISHLIYSLTLQEIIFLKYKEI